MFLGGVLVCREPGGGGWPLIHRNTRRLPIEFGTPTVAKRRSMDTAYINTRLQAELVFARQPLFICLSGRLLFILTIKHTKEYSQVLFVAHNFLNICCWVPYPLQFLARSNSTVPHTQFSIWVPSACPYT